MQKMVRRLPVTFSWLIVFLQILLGIGFVWLYRMLNSISEGFFYSFWESVRVYYVDVYNFVYTLIAILIIALLNWWQEVGFVKIVKRQDLFFYIIPALITFLILMPGISPNAAKNNLSISSIVFYLLLATREEIFSRGLIQYVLSYKGDVYAVFMSSIFFGLIHTSNLFIGVSSTRITLLQIIRAIAWGLGLAGLRLRLRYIFPLIIIHAITNIFTFITVDSLADIYWFSNSWYSSLPKAFHEVLVYELPAYLMGLYGLYLIINTKKENVKGIAFT